MLHSLGIVFVSSAPVFRMRLRKLWSGLLASGLLLVLTGCPDDAGGRYGVEGTVTLDGSPLPKGSISIRPQPGTRGPTAGGTITDGRFSILPEESLLPGSYRVEIRASRKTGKQKKDLTFGTMVDEIKQYLPAKYNTQSELKAEVKADGDNVLTYELSLEE